MILLLSIPGRIEFFFLSLRQSFGSFQSKEEGNPNGTKNRKQEKHQDETKA